ncbi:MAG: dephospho-CoA kinase [Planctomycetota bacterium]|nr:dephospho-CoA kinase [Planctomycetota bacterium]
MKRHTPLSPARLDKLQKIRDRIENAAYLVGISGGIGSGKSSVSAEFKRFGCILFDGDEAARQAFEDPEVQQALKDRWGERVFHPPGDINRQALASIVFQDPEELKILEELTHPWLLSRLETTVLQAVDDSSTSTLLPVLILDAALLHETGLDALCDLLIHVDVAREERVRRVVEHRGWDATELERRELNQIPTEQKKQLATVVIDNNGPPEGAQEEIQRIWETFITPKRKRH